MIVLFIHFHTWVFCRVVLCNSQRRHHKLLTGRICFPFQVHHHLPRTSLPQHHDHAAHRGHPGPHLDNVWCFSRAHGEVLRFQPHHELLCGLLHYLLGDYLHPVCLHVHTCTCPCQEDCCPAQWQWEASAPEAVGPWHERHLDSNHPIWGLYGLLGAIFSPPDHPHGVPHESVLRVLPIYV